MRINEYIDKILSMKDEDYESAVKAKGLQNFFDIQNYIQELFSERNMARAPKIEINALIYCNITHDAIIIHVNPDDLTHRMNSNGFKKSELELIDALEKIRIIM